MGIGRQLEDSQPGPGADQLLHGCAEVGVQVVPDDHQRAAELLLRGGQQAGVVQLREAFAPVLAMGQAMVNAVDDPGPVPGLDGDQRGQRHARVVRPGDRDHRGLPAPSLGSAPRRT